MVKSLSLVQIRPIRMPQGHFTFSVDLSDEEITYTVPVGADALVSYPLLSQCILGWTGRVWRCPAVEESLKKDWDDHYAHSDAWVRFLEDHLNYE